MKAIIIGFMFVFAVGNHGWCQPGNTGEYQLPDPKIAFLKSLAVPGWGHRYVNRDNWNRGKYHLAGEIVMILSYVGLRIHSSDLRDNWFTYARLEGGVNIEDRERRFRLAVGDFNNLRAYNEFQELNRNFDRLYEDIPENRWNWDTVRKRQEYNDLRNRFETIDRQLPAVLALMVVNRVVSGISAFNRARKAADAAQSAALYFSDYSDGKGVLANLRINF